MNIRHLFSIITATILMISLNAKAACVEGSNYLLQGGESYTLYMSLNPAFDGDLSVSVTSNYGEEVLVKDSLDQELFTVSTGSEVHGVYGDVNSVKATCLGLGNEPGTDCNIDWKICSEDSDFANPQPPTTHQTTIDGLVNDEGNNGFGVSLGYVFNTPEVGESPLAIDSSRTNDLISDPCPEGTVLTPFEMPVYSPANGIDIIGFQTVFFCIQEGTPIAE